MTNKPDPTISHVPWGLILLIVLFPVVMILLNLVDVQWTVQLSELGWERFGKVMDRSLFNGDKPGVSDPTTFLALVNLGFYLYFSPQRASIKLSRYRPFFGFALFCTLFTGLGLVHSLKWVIGRARPYLVLEGKLPYSNWFEFGPQFVTDGIFYGSFPSGHTASIIVLVTLSYFLISNQTHSSKVKVAGWIWGFVVLTTTLMMILGRSITLHHWITDSMGITLLSWIFIHLIYFYILKIPAQIRYVQTQNKYAPLPRYWELSLLWRLFIITIGIMSILIGFRSVFIEQSNWLVLIVVPGVILIVFYTRSFLQIYRTYMLHFQPFINLETHNLPNPTLS